MMNLVLLVIVSLGAGFGIFWFFHKIVWKKLFLSSLKLRLLSVRLPQYEETKEKKDIIPEINHFSQLLGALSNLKAPFSFEVAVHNVGEDINFYVAVPEATVEFTSRQIQGLWPNAQVERVEDYTIFNPQGAVRGAYLKQEQGQIAPIRTYVEAGLDTFSAVLSNFSKLNAVSEGLALQILVKPAPKFARQNISERVKKLKRGDQKPSKDKDKPAEPIIIDQEAIKILEQRLTKPLFAVNVRLLSSAQNDDRAKSLLEGLGGSFSQFASPTHNSFKEMKPRNLQKFIFEFIFRQFNWHETMILGADELASIYHFPTSLTDIPRIKWVKTRDAQPPLTLPKAGTLIGESVFRSEIRPVFITDEDRRRHVYTVGQTGTGKSNLLVNMVVGDIEKGKGVAVIDPHGDLIQSILNVIPDSREKDVIIFDPGDIQKPLGMNMLENDPSRPEEKTFIVNEMQSIFNKLFTAETMGPMFEQYMRSALLLLMDDPSEKATLMEVPRVFTDAEYRKRLLSRATNPAVIDFWEKEAVKVGGEASLANMTPYITSKFNNFIANDYVRPIIGQQISAFNFRRLMDEGKILLVNLSKGRIGDINAGLLGMVVVGKILMSALSRVDLPQEKRRDFNLYIDEFQNFTTDSIATILSEARKYRLNLVIAHQFIAQLEEKIRDAVFGNVGSQIVFRVGAEDAEFLVKQFEPIFTKNDLINLDNFNAYVKILINGQTTSPFNIHTLKAKAGIPEKGPRIKEWARNTYGRDRSEIEMNILARLRR